MEFNHIPIMLEECIENLNIKPQGIYVDGTLGGAGHSSHIIKRLNSEGLLIGIDQDQNAIEAATSRLKEVNSQARFILKRTNFKNIKSVLLQMNIEAVNGVLLDLGVSSHQLDEGARGFSYNHDARLDMRMSDENSLDAEYVVNHYTKEELAKVIKEFGEEKWAFRIADFIVKERAKYRIKTTWQLVDVIKMAVPAAARREGPHPAKRTFQAIRIEVNQELNVLTEALKDIMDILSVGGRLSVITFHSLEDRIVKDFFNKRARPCECPSQFPICVCGKNPDLKIITRKPIVPLSQEIEINKRSRSAKLRVAEKI